MEKSNLFNTERQSKTSRQVKRGRDNKIPQSSSPPVEVGDEAVHKELGERMERAATTASSLEVEHDSGAKIPHIHHTLTASPTIYTSLIEQFWQTAALCTIDDGVLGITATIDRQVDITVSEGSIRRHLKLEDSKGIPSLPTAEIFAQLALIGTFNFLKFIFDAMVKNLDSTHKFLMYPQFIQIFLNKHQRLLFPDTRTYPTPSLTHKLFSNMKRVSKGFSGVITPLFDTMLVQHQGEEPSIQTTPETSPSKITSSPSLSSHHISISALSPTQPPITPTKEVALMSHESPLYSVHSLGRDEGSIQQHELMDLVTKLTDRIGVLEKDLQQTKKTYSTALTRLILRVKKLEKNVKTCKARRRARIVISEDEDAAEDSSKEGRKISDIDTDPTISLVQPQQDMEYDFDATASIPVTTASASISTVSPLRVSTAEEISGAEKLVYIRRSASKVKDKGKAIMQESEPPNKIKKKLDEREEVTAKEAYDIDWSDPSVLRYHALQNRPFFVAEVRKNMCMYQKNQGGYKMSHFKGMSYEEIRPIFERVWDQIQSFVPMDSEKEKGSEKKTEGRLKRACQVVVEEPAKRQKTTEASKSVQEQPSEEPKADELSQEQLQQMMLIVPEEGMHIEALQIKYPIIDWQVHSEDTMKFWKIIRVGNHTESLVKERFNSPGLTDDKEKELWVKLKRLFEPDNTDTLWKLQRYMHDPLKWWLYDTCSVHHVSTERGHDIFMLVEKDYPLTIALMTLMLCNKLRVDQYSEMADELLQKIFILVNRPRHTNWVNTARRKVSTASTELSDKERRNALSISKLKAAYYLDFRLKELILSLWIESEGHYDINSAYGISHRWFKCKEFYITRHSSPSNRSAVRSHMKIINVFGLKTFSRYGYTYLKEIVLRRADYKEYKISEADFKNLHPNDFEDLYLLHLQGKLNHLYGADKVHLFNAVNL
ncbi:hypothetical protein Tco_0483703 [Tanacetum coccineum]